MKSMKSFSQIVNSENKIRESRTATSMLQSEITDYIRKVNRILPDSIRGIIALTQRLNLTSADQIEQVRTANKSQLAKVAKELGVSEDQVIELHDSLKRIGKNIKLLPQYQSEAEREAIKAGKLALDDLTIDLDTPAGRNAAAKVYTPLVLKIASQYVGQSRLTKADLISAGMEGLVQAMSDWKKESKDGEKRTTFRTFAAYTVQHAILDEINANGHTLSGTNWYAVDKFGAAMLDAVSLDGLTSKNDDDFDQDHLVELGDKDSNKDFEGEEKNWKEIYKMIETKFSTRDVDIFYRYFGLGPYYGKRQKVKDIAKEYNMSDGNIHNSILGPIFKFLRTNPKAARILGEIRDSYTESLVGEIATLGKECIREALYNDMTFILLEQVTRWNNKQTLERAVLSACDKMSINDAKFILTCLTKGMDAFNAGLSKNRKAVVFFLSEVYPAESMNRKKDADLADYMEELVTATQMLKIDW